MLSDVAVVLRTLQLYYHSCHNIVVGPDFNHDHALFGDFYEEVEDDYDAMIEESILNEGRNGINLKNQLKQIYDNIKAIDVMTVDRLVMYRTGIQLEKKLQTMLEECKKSNPTLGTETLLGDVAKKCGVRLYKMIATVGS